MGASVCGGARATSAFTSMLLLVGERRKLVDLDGGLVLDLLEVGIDGIVDDGEREAVGGEGEVLSGALDGRGGDAEELLAVVGLEDADLLGGELVGEGVLARRRGRRR